MEASREEVKEAILLFATLYNNQEGFSYLLNQERSPYPEIVNLIIREMFMNRFDFHNCSEAEYNAYKIILDYYSELHTIGYVKHDR